MSPKKFKAIREKMDLTQDELARLLGLAGKKTISHFETGFRTPSPIFCAVMTYMESLSERKAQEFIEEFGRHIVEAEKSIKAQKRE